MRQPVGSASNDNATVLARSIVAKANAIGATLTSDMATVWRVIDANEVVYAVWQDRGAPGGVGILIVKGQQQLAAIVASGQPEALSWSAISCISAEQAEALRIVTCERNPLH